MLPAEAVAVACCQLPVCLCCCRGLWLLLLSISRNSQMKQSPETTCSSARVAANAYKVLNVPRSYKTNNNHQQQQTATTTGRQLNNRATINTQTIERNWEQQQQQQDFYRNPFVLIRLRSIFSFWRKWDFCRQKLTDWARIKARCQLPAQDMSCFIWIRMAAAATAAARWQVPQYWARRQVLLPGEARVTDCQSPFHGFWLRSNVRFLRHVEALPFDCVKCLRKLIFSTKKTRNIYTTEHKWEQAAHMLCRKCC